MGYLCSLFVLPFVNTGKFSKITQGYVIGSVYCAAILVLQFSYRDERPCVVWAH